MPASPTFPSVSPLNTMERMVLCCAIQQDIDALLTIFETVEAMTVVMGDPPSEIREAFEAQISKEINHIFRHAVQG